MSAWRIVKLTVASVLICGIFIIAGGFIYAYYQMNYRVQAVDVLESPDGEYLLALEQIGEPGFPFGPVKARVSLQKSGRVTEKHNTKVADDGASLGKHHWTVTWFDGYVEIVLDASEQKPEYIVFNLE